MMWKWTIWIAFAATTLGSCHSSSGSDTDLLTHSPWRYVKASFNSDDQSGERFNALDPRIIGFEKEYSIIFRPDGTGALKEEKAAKHHTDHPGPDSLPFIWSLSDKDSLLYFQDQYYKIQTLDKEKLVIYADQQLGGINSRYTVVLGH